MSSRALAQRRHAERDHVQPVVEVLAEAALLRSPSRGSCWSRRSRARRPRASRCRRRARSCCSCSTRSTLACVIRLMSPISSRKIVPPCGQLELAALLGHRAGERALLVAEQLGLDQLLGDRRAVHLDERGARARLLCSVDLARDQLLAGAVLAGDQHPAVGGRGHLRSARFEVARSRRDAPRISCARSVCARSAPVLAPRGASCSSAWREREQQLVDRERLLDEVEGAELGGAHRGLDGAVPAHHHDRQRAASARAARSSTAMPSRPGIAMSSSTRSGGCSRASDGERRVAVVGDARSRSPRRRGCPPASAGCCPRRRRSGCGSASSTSLARIGARGQLDDEARAARRVAPARGRSRGGRRRCARRSRARGRCRAPWSRSTARRCAGGPRAGCRRRRRRPRGARSGAARRSALRTTTRPPRRRSAALHRGDRVVDQVGERAPDLLAVDVDRAAGSGSSSASKATSLGARVARDGLADERFRSSRLRVRGRQPREVRELVDQQLQPVDLAGDRVDALVEDLRVVGVAPRSARRSGAGCAAPRAGSASAGS